jgi:ATP-dependent RNA helicase SUPV3L1/SUV3
VFTDRLLHARGLVETMFLGAETIRPLLQRLVPQATIETRPRFSRLSHAGPVKLVRLPPRSAVVAFSAAEVYAIAELIRRRRGGCAVVMGRLSPRTRNAQVALYQDQEVDFLVATDAIGMGLNMDVNHVAFAAMGKFDGHRPRRLTPAEVAQIAGRAGRGMRDGTFGTTAQCPPLGDEVAAAVEAHSFEALDQLCWRNSDLDLSHVDALLATLMAPPPGPGLVKGNDAADLETLAALAHDPEIRHLAHGRRMVRRLWEACQIPDFRKLSDDTHTKLCARVFGHVARDQHLPTDWLAGQIGALARADGDIDTLMQRLAGVRVWSYIAARADWVRDSPHWQGRAREVEDLLSDALHERLTSRFVDRRAAHLMRRLEASETEELLSAVTRRGEVIVEGHPVGRIAGFSFFPDPSAVGDEKRLVQRAARRALREEIPRRVATVETAADAAFAIGDDNALVWDGASIARLRRGNSALRPRVQVLDSEFLDGAQRERLRIRLQRFVDDRVSHDLAPLLAVADRGNLHQQFRGLLHRLTEALGLITSDEGDTLAPPARAALKAIGVKAGRFGLFLPPLLKPRAAAMRSRLWGLQHGVAVPELPPPEVVSLLHRPDWPAGFADAMGWLEAGPVLLRLDIAERVAAELAWAARRGATAMPAGLASRFSLKADLLPVVLRRLGFRVVPAEVLAAHAYGPPAPAMLLPLRRRRPVTSDVPQVDAHGPFAALAALRS